MKRDSAATKWLLGSLILAVMLITSVTGFGAYLINGSHEQPLPTLNATAVAIADPPTATLQGTAVPPTYTPRPTTAVPSRTPSPSPGPTVTPSRTATATLTPSATPTSRPQQDPTLPPLITLDPELILATPATPIPTPVPRFELPAHITNVLLLGKDTPLEARGGRTDTIIIVSIDRSNQTAAMLTVPRDLYVYLPERGMDRINNVMGRGGPELMKSTILYNFGVPIHYYALIDFDGFKQVIDILGGIELAVSCQFTFWHPSGPDLNLQLEENWTPVQLSPGFHHLDGELALWYARSRNSPSADWDRGRRQQQMLRAILNRGIDRDLVSQAPALYAAFNNMVETDMDIGRILQLATIAPSVRQNGIQHLYLAGKTRSWIVPVPDVEVQPQVLLPIWEGSNMMGETFQRLFLPPAINRANRPPITVAISNGSGNADMARLAADNLAWYGFVPIIVGDSEATPDSTLYYYAQNFKGGSYEAAIISWLFRQRAGNIQLVPNTPYDYNYRVVLGADYNPCLNSFYAPQINLGP